MGHNFLMKIILGACLILALAFSVSHHFIFTDSRIFKNDKIWSEITASKSSELQTLANSLDQGEPQVWMADNAPILWWHPKEKYKATDPQELLPTIEIWYREVSKIFPFIDKEFVNLGPFKPEDLKTLHHQGYSPSDDITRLFENGGVNEGLSGFELRYDTEKIMNKPSPLLWRLSHHPMFKNIQSSDPNELIIPIEFWYHFNFNDTGILIGNHDGDWESVLFVFKVSVKGNETKAAPIYIVTSAHGGSTWHCTKDVGRTDGRFDLYSAVGTHATYTDIGNHWRFLVYPDQSARGEPWDTWKVMRPIVKENFYGYSGSWGRTSFVHFQNAPLPPGPHFKYLPADDNLERSIRSFQKTESECRENSAAIK